MSQPAKPRRTVALVGCCAQKLDHAAPARELYVSPLFRLSLAYAERILGAETYVLSAMHGVVPLDRVLEPYDLSLQEMDEYERAWWRHEVEEQLGELLGATFDTIIPVTEEEDTGDPCDSAWFLHDPNLRVILLAGALYRPGGFLEGKLEEPMEGMGIGERLAFLKNALEAAAEEEAQRARAIAG